MNKYTTVSFEGTRDEVNALTIVALKNKTAAGSLVRKAVIAMFGKELAEAASFFSPGEQRSVQPEAQPVKETA